MPVFEKDLVLIYFEDEPMGFARVEEISPDIKKGWFNVRLLLLNLPLQTITWILRDVYIDGDEFTMGGRRVRLEKVEAPPEDFFDEDMDDDDFDDIDDDLDFVSPSPQPVKILSRSEKNGDAPAQPAKSGKIISFDDFKNRKK